MGEMILLIIISTVLKEALQNSQSSERGIASALEWEELWPFEG